MSALSTLAIAGLNGNDKHHPAYPTGNGNGATKKLASYLTHSPPGLHGDEEQFRLDDSFLGSYKTLKPKFGYNGLGEFVFYRTYSRLKPDNTKETFLDVIRRVVEGCYEIQRRHCRQLHIPWDYPKALDSAHEMFQRMWDFKFLPPGRGLWCMGTQFMWERGSAALNNCFSGDTEIITRDGIKPIGPLAGTTQELLTTGGKWVKAPIKSFGKQELYKLTLERAGVQKVVYTTADHRWFARDRRQRERPPLLEDAQAVIALTSNGRKKRTSAYREVFTKDLKTTHALRYVFGQGIQGNVRPSPFGVAHGVAYGDGTTGQDSESCGTYLYLCGKKNEELLEYFPNCPATPDASKGEEGAIRVADLPRFFRRPPSLRESKSYLYGWLAGYFAADGKINKAGNCIKISSSSHENMLLVRDVCAVLGIGTYSISPSVHTVRHNGQAKKFIGYEIGLMASHLRPDFFLLSEHRSRFEGHTSHRERPVYHWRVKSVEATGEMAEVFCPQVPNTNAFALADNILTGNCGFVSTTDLGADPAEPFCFLMDMSMLGVGVGFDTRGRDQVTIHRPSTFTRNTYKVLDTREGWVESVRLLIMAYTSHPEIGLLDFDYSEIRPAGTPIKGFGGFASGPSVLMDLHVMLRYFLESRIGKVLTSRCITDIMNMIGAAVVAGNVRRTAEIAFGDADDFLYTTMKNPVQGLSDTETTTFWAVSNRLYKEKITKVTTDEFNGWLGKIEKERQSERNQITRAVETVEDAYKNGDHSISNKMDSNPAPCFAKDLAVLAPIPDSKLHQAIETWNYLNQHRWASNNSVFAHVGMDYRGPAASTAINGEPGFIWLENIRDYGRMVDGLKPGIDGRAMGTNPCLTGDTKLLTSSGYRTMLELWEEGGYQEYDGKPSIAKHGALLVANHRGIVQATNVYRTSERAPVFRVTFSNGQHIDATENHRFVVLHDGNEIVVQTKDLQPGNKVPLGLTQTFGGHNDPDYALLAGWVIGDGSLSPQKDGQVTAHVTCYQDDCDDVLPELQRALDTTYEKHQCSSHQRPKFEPWERKQEYFKHRQMGVRSSVLGRLLKQDGVVPGDKHRVPASIWRSDHFTVAAFLRGLFSADGSVQANRVKKSISVRLAQNSASLLRDCQLLLSQFGITSAVFSRRSASKQLMNDGKGGQKLYNRAEQFELIISGHANVDSFVRSIGFVQPSKTEKAMCWLIDHKGSNNSVPKTCCEVVSVEYLGEQPTFCLTEPGTNRIIANGIEISQCGEQTLESYELCVSGDTRIQTRTGCPRIADVVGQKVDVWNGDDWSTVTPRVTGHGRELYRVHLSDGSYLDVTDNHAWPVKKPRQRIYKRVETKDLQEGWIVQGFNIVSPGGVEVEHAFELGFCAGDGFLDLVDRPQYTRPMAVICGDKAKLEQLGMGGKWHKPQVKDGYAAPYNRVNMQGLFSAEQLMELRDKDAGLPDWIMAMDRDSVLQFVAGWIESDGCVCRQANTEGYRIYGLESKMRDLQLLLRRVGINHASVNFCHPAGQETNKGVRQRDLWYVQIPSFECAEIPTRLKRAEKIGCRFRRNPLGVIDDRYRGSQIDMAKKQKIVKVEKLPGTHTTYCFDEPINHMGVFGNSLTFQCNLVETFTHKHDSPDDYIRTLKFAYLYAKTVTLLPTHNVRTNQVMLRNRRIGVGQSGIVQAFEKFGRRKVLRDFCDAGYAEVRRWDRIYAEWLCIPQSIKVTCVKPSGTVSLVVGATPGIHYPEASYYWRHVRVARDSVMVDILRDAGYFIEPAVNDPERTVVVRFAVDESEVRPVEKVSMWEQTQNVADYQKYWTDNQPSCTVKFQRHEASQIPNLLQAYEDRLKCISFLPHEDHGYPQAPYVPCTKEEVEEYNAKVRPIDFSRWVGEDADVEGVKGCDGTSCAVPGVGAQAGSTVAVAS